MMATEAQVVANRLNARKSTGPRTPDGKAAVAQNAVRHGLLAQQVVIRGEDPGEFEFYRDQMLGELSPAGAMESMLAERVVGLAWRLRRAERIQAEVFDSMLFVVVRDFANSRVLDRLGLYERRIEYSLYKTMTELQRLRLLRELDPPLEAESTPEPASRTEDDPLRQTKPISPVLGQKAGFAGQSKASQSQFGLPLTDRTVGDRQIRSAKLETRDQCKAPNGQ